MADLRKIYWDSNAWVSLICRTATRVQALETIYHLAKKNDGRVEIWTSVITLAEVYKMADDPAAPRPLEEQQARIGRVLYQPFIKLIEVNRLIIDDARDLLQAYPALKKPYDAVHLASALRWNANALHTYDRANLLGLDGQIRCRNGDLLEICRPETDSHGPLWKKGDDPS